MLTTSKKITAALFGKAVALRNATTLAVVQADAALDSVGNKLGNMKTSEKAFWMAFFSLAAAHGANAQSPKAKAAMENVQNTAIQIGQVVFLIFLMVGLVRTAKKFIDGAPDAMTSGLWLLGGVLIFAGFQAFKDDIFSNMGASSTGGGVK
ncbi:hypothetical protein KLP40_14565 [Hymenobacter sp. NST-14]|uniref:hypothetical protein n=1 Tax=Hymenobacter piscis TaxID=2839984 RepID=UPI001C035688|nr:hypothetical protein [Hymenobacter piscis]MBT9394391.1 hypothetical protein [Hymenobacter piscis]